MARPKEKTTSAFHQKCTAASEKLASFQACTLKEDIERLYTDELFADLNIDLGYRKCALHKCIVKARNADLYKYLVSVEGNKTCQDPMVTTSHCTDIENSLRSLYTDEDVSTALENLDKYFHPEASNEHTAAVTLPEPHTNAAGGGPELVTGEDLHVISENITNTSLDLVKTEASNYNRGQCSCFNGDVRSEDVKQSCDIPECDRITEGSRENSLDGKAKDGKPFGKKLCVCENSQRDCCCGRGKEEENIYKLAERIVEQVIREAQNIVANVNVLKTVNDTAKSLDRAKENQSVINCNGDAKIGKSIRIDAGSGDGQKSGICSSKTSRSKKSNEKQTDPAGSCRFRIRKNKETVQRLLERVYGVKTLMKPCSVLGEDLLRMLLLEECADCTVEVQGQLFPAHRCILAARSSYFAAMLGGSWRESEEDNIVLEGVLPSVLKQTLLYLYGGVIDVDPQCTLGGLIMMADMYGMEGLKEVVAFNLNVQYCHFFHRPCPECIAGVPEALALTMMYNMDAMKEKCVRWINKNFGKVWPSKSLATLPQEVLEFTVSSAIKDLALNNVLDILIDCQRLNEKTPHLKWTEPVFDMITQLMDAAIEFASQNFISLISGNTFKKIDKEGIAFNRQPLEDIFGMIIQAMSPGNACLAYLSLNKWSKAVEQTADDQIPLYSEEFAAFVNILLKKCKDHLCTYIHQAAYTVEWDLLTKDMQQTIMQDANYVCIDTNRGRMARPKLTSMQKKISATSPMSLKEYFECHFGQVKPPNRKSNPRKDNPLNTKKTQPLALSRETTRGGKGRQVAGALDLKKMAADKTSVKTVKQITKHVGKGKEVAGGEKEKQGKLSKAKCEQNLEKIGLNETKVNQDTCNMLSGSVTQLEGKVNETDNDFCNNDCTETILLDLHNLADIELVDLAQGLIFYVEKPLPVFEVIFLIPDH